MILHYRLWIFCCIVEASALIGRAAFAQDAGPTPPAEAPGEQDKDKLRELVRQASAAYAKQDWEAARVAYSEAWRTKPHPLIAANLADVEFKLGRYAAAAEHFQFFLKNMPPGTQPEKQASAEQQLVECRNHVATITVSTDVPGTRVTIDFRVVGETPLDRLLFIPAGNHVVEVFRDGQQAGSRSIDVKPGAELNVEFKIAAVAPAPKQPAAPEAASLTPTAVQPSHSISPRTWAAIGGSVATAISLGVGIGFRLRANSLGSDVDDKIAQLDALPSIPAWQKAAHQECISPTGAAIGFCEQLRSTLHKQDSAIDISTGALVTAGVLGVATAATYFLWPKQKSSPTVPGKVAFGVTPWSLGKAQGIQFYSVF